MLDAYRSGSIVNSDHADLRAIALAAVGSLYPSNDMNLSITGRDRYFVIRSARLRSLLMEFKVFGTHLFLHPQILGVHVLALAKASSLCYTDCC